MRIIQCNKPDRNHDPSQELFENEACNRHILLFGSEMQKKMSTLTIGIGGLGGAGMITVEQVMRLFPNKIIITDFDYVETSNLNRLTGATYLDVILKTKKTDMAYKHIKNFNPEQKVTKIEGNFLDKNTQEAFKECDIFISTFDSVSARLAANQLCITQGILLIDCGIGAISENNQITAAGGQIIIIKPDSKFCLSCSEIYNNTDAIKDFMSPDERKRQENMGYIKNANIKAPQVYPLNMITTAWAIWIIMQKIAQIKIEFDGLAINALTHQTHTWKEQPTKNCPICGTNGMKFEGEKAELLTRNNQNQTDSKNPEKYLNEISQQPSIRPKIEYRSSLLKSNEKNPNIQIDKNDPIPLLTMGKTPTNPKIPPTIPNEINHWQQLMH